MKYAILNNLDDSLMHEKNFAAKIFFPSFKKLVSVLHVILYYISPLKGT